MTIVIVLLALVSILSILILLKIIRHEHHFSSQEKQLDKLERNFREEISKNREELNNSLKLSLDSFNKILSSLTQSIEFRLKSLQEDNGKKLDLMRATVDEKLHQTLEKRLGESFQLVSQRLEAVHNGLGEMQTLAVGVGDLKKVLTNVKTRGTWGEIQLENLLDQILTKDQYSKNVATKKNSQDRVEFALKLPGNGVDQSQVWIPIDAKLDRKSVV